MATQTSARASGADMLAERYRAVRALSKAIAAPLSDADATLQPSPDASPAKWHLAHLTWFFETFVLRDHRKFRRAPELVLSDRMQHRYPQLVAAVAERMFVVDNPNPKPGLGRIIAQERRRAGIRRRDLARDGWAGLRTFG